MKCCRRARWSPHRRWSSRPSPRHQQRRKAMAVNGEKIPIVLQLDEKTLIDGAVVKPVTFSGFTEYLAEASALMAPRTIDAKLRRVRLAKQVTYYANGTVAPISMTDVLKLSIPSARKLSARLDDSQGVAGKLVRD